MTPFWKKPGSYQSIYVLENNQADATSVTRSLNVTDSFRSISNRALFKFINGSDQSIDLYILRPGQNRDQVAPFLNDVGFAATINNEIIANTVEFEVRNSENTETLASLTRDLQEGINYTVLLDAENVLHVLED